MVLCMQPFVQTEVILIFIFLHCKLADGCFQGCVIGKIAVSSILYPRVVLADV